MSTNKSIFFQRIGIITCVFTSCSCCNNPIVSISFCLKKSFPHSLFIAMLWIEIAQCSSCQVMERFLRKHSAKLVVISVEFCPCFFQHKRPQFFFFRLLKEWFITRIDWNIIIDNDFDRNSSPNDIYTIHAKITFRGIHEDSLDSLRCFSECS